MKPCKAMNKLIKIVLINVHDANLECVIKTKIIMTLLAEIVLISIVLIRIMLITSVLFRTLGIKPE